MWQHKFGIPKVKRATIKYSIEIIEINGSKRRPERGGRSHQLGVANPRQRRLHQKFKLVVRFRQIGHKLKRT